MHMRVCRRGGGASCNARAHGMWPTRQGQAFAARAAPALILPPPVLLGGIAQLSEPCKPDAKGAANVGGAILSLVSADTSAGACQGGVKALVKCLQSGKRTLLAYNLTSIDQEWPQYGVVGPVQWQLHPQVRWGGGASAAGAAQHSVQPPCALLDHAP